MVDTLPKPDVIVRQEFGPQAPSLLRPTLQAVIVGVCHQIETKKLAGSYFGAAVDFDYPGIKLGAIVSVGDTKVYLQQGTDLFDITDDLTGGSITADLVSLPDTFVPSKPMGAQRQVSTVAGTRFVDLGADFVALGVKAGDILNFITADPDLDFVNSVASAQSGDFTVLEVVSPTELLVTPTLIDETNVEYQLKRNGLSSGDVLITYKARRVDGVGTLFEHQTSDEADTDLGSNVPENPLRYGVGIALLHTKGLVASVMLETDDLDGHTKAAEFLESKDVYAIVPLSQNPAILQMWKLHADQMSEPDQKSERIVIANQAIEDRTLFQGSSTTGATAASSDVFTDASAKFITNGVPVGAVLNFGSPRSIGGQSVTQAPIKAVLSETQVKLIATADNTQSGITYTVQSKDYSKFQKALNLQNLGKGYADHRFVMVMPDIALVSSGDTQAEVPGYFLACAVAGLISGSSPAQGFTNFPFAGFVGLKNSNFFFSEFQMDVIAAGGIFLFIQESLQAPVKPRHQLTTDVTSVEKRELSIQKADDFVAKFIRAQVRGLIGINNISPEFMNNTLKPQTNGIIESLVGDRIVGRNTQMLRMEQSATKPDSIEIDIRIEHLYPANTLDYTLIV